MQLRPFDPVKDFGSIQNWIGDERSHAMWCANRFRFPLDQSDLSTALAENKERYGDSPFVATEENGRIVGFFCYSFHEDTKEGMLKFVMVDPDHRSEGLGGKMLTLLLTQAFENPATVSVCLNVYRENPRAVHCYEKIGFIVRETTENAFSFQKESWTKYNMIRFRNQ